MVHIYRMNSLMAILVSQIHCHYFARKSRNFYWYFMIQNNAYNFSSFIIKFLTLPPNVLFSTLRKYNFFGVYKRGTRRVHGLTRIKLLVRIWHKNQYGFSVIRSLIFFEFSRFWYHIRSYKYILQYIYLVFSTYFYILFYYCHKCKCHKAKIN